MKYIKFPRNQAIKDLLNSKKLKQKEFADILKIKPQMVSAVINDRNSLTKDMILYVINNSPEIALEYGFLNNNQCEESQDRLNVVEREMMYLKGDVHRLKNEMDKLNEYIRKIKKQSM